MLAKIGKFLTTRFPEKRVVTVDEYYGMHGEISHIRSSVTEMLQRLENVENRLSTVEINAVHKGAVSDLVTSVKALKEDYTTFKANMLPNKPLSAEDIQALYNGEYLNGERI
jgi:uncharacterized coiled-coil DUF342 family protein